MPAWIVVLPILLLLGLLLVGGVALVVVLLVSPRSRPVGVVLAVLGGLLLCGVVAAFGFLFVARGAAVHTEAMHAMKAQRIEAEAAARLERMREDLDGPPLPTPYPEPGIDILVEGESGTVTEEPSADPSEPAGPAASEPPAGPGGNDLGGGDAPAEEAGAGSAAPASEQTEPASGEGPAAASAQEVPPELARPEWVESRPQRVDDGYQMSITVGPYTSRLECDAQLPAALQVAVEEYLSIYLGPQWSGRIRLPADMLEEELVKDQWEETIQASVGPMVQLHVLLDFDSKFRQTVCEMRDQSIVAGRLWLAGTGLGVVLAWLALAVVFLRIDQATAGAYRGRLAAACILAAVAVLLAAGVVLRAAGPAPLALEHVPAGSESEQLPPTLDGVLGAPAPSDELSLARAAEARGGAHAAHANWSVFALVVGLLTLAGLAVLVAFRRTRVVGIVLLAVVVVGALLLVA